MNARSAVFPQSTDSLINLKAKLRMAPDSLNASLTDSIYVNDSLGLIVADSISGNDTVNVDEQSEIQDIITYKAQDSIVYDMSTKKMILYNAGDVNYQKIKLKANSIDFDWTTFTLTSEGTLDSAGELQGKPIFSDGEKEYRSRKMLYNFKTKKGKVFDVTTQEGDAYLHSAEIKKNEYDEWYGRATKYTTCDLEHPHFYFKAKKVKVIPNKVLVTGAANLWVGDVPTPLFVPFAFFPVKQGKKSGIIVPQYGQDAVFGFFLRDGGYYWAVNDYLGLKFLGQVGTNGTFGVGTVAQYALRYKFTGSVAFSYLRSRPSDPDLPGAKATNAYSFAWSHQQDPRSIPNSTFGASVQVQSSDFYRDSRITDQRLLSTTFNSGINFSRVFPRTPVSLTMSVRHTQNLLNRTIGFTLPVIRLSVSRVTPFKSKVTTGKPKWYENIGFNYFIEMQSVLNTYDSLLFTSTTKDKFSFGINQQLNIDAPIVLFKYLNLNPAFSYQERTYFRGINTRWNSDTIYQSSGEKIDTIYGRVEQDTVWKFNSARNFNLSLTLNTKIYGFFKFKGKWLKGIKHVFTPSVSFNYHPDFGAAPFRYYVDVQSNADGRTTKYSVFERSPLYGIPGVGMEGSVFISLNNNFEAKVFSKKDTVTGTRKMGLLDQVNLTGGYNFAAKEFKVLPINLTVVSTKVFNLINLNFNAQFDPYAVDSFNRRINKFEWNENRRLLRFSTANIGASMNLNSKTRPTPEITQAPPSFAADYVSYNPNQIYNFDIPWRLSLGYNFNLSKGTTFNPDTIITMQTVRAGLDFNITPKWKVAVSSGFDITRKQVTLTNVSVVRDLHCWELSFTWTPSLPSQRFQQFTILLHPKSNTLKDLKIQRRNQLQQEF